MKKEMNARIIQVKDIDIGSNIARMRKEKNILQKDMVTKLYLEGVDISVYSYNKIERGIQNPTVSLLLSLCKILKCDMNDIFGL